MPVTMSDCRHQISLIKDLVVWMGGRMITADIDIAADVIPSYEQNDGSLTKFDKGPHARSEGLCAPPLPLYKAPGVNNPSNGHSPE